MGEASRSDRPPAAPSATFGKYQLLASLGQGGMAEVYLAVVRGLVGFNKLVVVKRLRSSLMEEPEFVPMFLDEARLAARLNHPNIVQTNEVGEVDGEFFIAMEYLEGQPLNRILSRCLRRQTPIPTPVFLHVLAEALAGLHHAHELKDFDGTPLNVVHRDASPHNIFVTYEGCTKYVAGAVAARRSQTGRIAFIGGYVSPQGVIRANGYIRGAQSVNPDIKVEVRWLGFWFDANPDHDQFDEKLEVQLANRAIDSGCDVIIANLDNELSYEAVERARVDDGKDVWSIATNNPTACAKYPNTCLGVAALNWTSIYTQQLDAMHKGTWEPEYVHAPMLLDEAESPVTFLPYEPNTAVDTSLAIGTLVGRLVDDPDLVLRGPYETTGQRAAVAPGENITDDELLHMCWFPKGAVERADPEDPESDDVDAIVPDGTRTLLSGDSPDCRTNQNQ